MIKDLGWLRFVTAFLELQPLRAEGPCLGFMIDKQMANNYNIHTINSLVVGFRMVPLIKRLRFCFIKGKEGFLQ
ncbi:MAG: hypothetical protein CO135_03785 [Candidatus Levybacteria bacterium CG_4_9_14_3_um_filter_35_16]|nr:MAG: hypothetical protein COW87_03160 [Candidatus Levybacteria bacterium CG22_combo_CG10-13_8_21_14_all_35_11]PIZ98806.1 MAG: hypothetical protein COX78_02730 [Candidatus Levybacteria bacterium CG_4_10_14_0_2_um_filter_35_8]PJA90926.1 MAG: hypothetical protein CO135_03785 [Candidatus Levybacteria bacterium CG_4_9_14_3_um_filter_35_16]PJC54706.1 MAG: hypothetical protein CO028_01070 [Candidatus Levybacteria bacterium CG_4_9_14_0_2_um_filter_35_21]